MIVDDQAAGLRLLADQRRASGAYDRSSEGYSRVICIASGKGGVGKTNLTANLGICLAQLGNRVLLLDADLGLANLDVIMGITPRLTLEHFVRGDVMTVREVVETGPAGVRVVAGGSGIAEMADLPANGRERLLQGVLALEELADLVLLDTGAGIHTSVMSFVRCASEVLVVTTPEPTAMADAYALIKVVASQDPEAKLGLVANMCRDAAEGKAVMDRLSMVASQFLNVRVRALGWVPRDERVVAAVRRREPFVLAAPSSPAARSVREIAETLSLSACRTRDPDRGLAAAVTRLRGALLGRRGVR
jgi:flagellar biosynthesis protein FlhG